MMTNLNKRRKWQLIRPVLEVELYLPDYLICNDEITAGRAIG